MPRNPPTQIQILAPSQNIQISKFKSNPMTVVHFLNRLPMVQAPFFCPTIYLARFVYITRFLDNQQPSQGHA